MGFMGVSTNLSMTITLTEGWSIAYVKKQFKLRHVGVIRFFFNILQLLLVRLHNETCVALASSC